MSKTKQAIRILIADHQHLFRAALHSLLEEQEDMSVVGEAANGREAIDLVRRLAPDLLLLNLFMPGMGGMEALRSLVKNPSPPRVVIFDDLGRKQEIIEALILGVRGVIPRDTSPQMLFKSLRAVSAGEYWVRRQSIADLLEYVRHSGAPQREIMHQDGHSLTRREIDVMNLVVEGYPNRDIAKKLSISEQTVKHHLTSIFGKVGVANRLELALFAMRQSFP